MKIGDDEFLSLNKRTRDELLEVNTTRAIVSDEFNRRELPGTKNDYRERAIDRLIKNNKSFYNEDNITWEIIKRYISVTCPYCKGKMNGTTGSGNGSHTSQHYHCAGCGSEASLSFGSHSIRFEPKEEK
mgnify:CR=1 FL=1